MNIALEQTEEHVNGRVTNRYGDAFIRGNNGEYIRSVWLWIVIDVISQYFISPLQNPCNIACPSISMLSAAYEGHLHV